MAMGYNPFSFSQYQAWQAGNQAPWNQVGPPGGVYPHPAQSGGVTNPQTQGVIAPAPVQPYGASNYLAGGTSNQIPGFNPMASGGGFYPTQPAAPAAAPAAPAPVGGFGFGPRTTMALSTSVTPEGSIVQNPVMSYQGHRGYRDIMNQYAQQIGQQPTDAPVPPGMAADQSLAQQAGGGVPAGPNPFLGFGFPTTYRMG